MLPVDLSGHKIDKKTIKNDIKIKDLLPKYKSFAEL
jgi:hypothetical protein